MDASSSLSVGVNVGLTDPTTTALLAAKALHEAGVPHAVYGGLMLAAYGEPRETRDAALAVMSAGASAAAEALRRLGIDAEIVFEDVVFAGLSISRVAVLGVAGATGLNTIDLIRPRSDRFAKEVLRRSIEAPLRGELIRVVTPEDFVLLKILSTRERDIEDAACVLAKLGSDVDRATIDAEILLLIGEHPEVPVRPRYEAACERAGSL